MLPPSTNADYRGHPAAAWLLGLFGLGTIAPGLIHFSLPDGGAGVIAGLDLSTRRDLILAMFAWIGAMQIPHGVAELAIAWRYRPLVPLFLALAAVERGLMSWDGWLGKGAIGASLSGHHPPEHYASPVAVVLALLGLALSLRRSHS